MNVPFLDLKAQYRAIKPEIDGAIAQVVEQTAFAGGPFVKQFEDEYAAWCGTRHAVGLGSGTEALWLPLVARGIGPGDEVITVPNTFIATLEAISLTGATPVLVDVTPGTLTMDPGLLEQAITPRTRAVIPVHLFGHPADMDPILAIARKHGLLVIEDACQAHGAEYKGRKAGTLGDAAAFSFYPGKNLGAYGDAGGMTTDDDGIAAMSRMVRDHGQARKYYHQVVGWNARMDGIQGAVLSVKLRHIDRWNDARRENARLYRERLAGIPGLTLPAEAAWAKHVYHLFPVSVANRDGVLAALERSGVSCGIHYPVPVHLQNAYRHAGWKKGDFPVAEKAATLSLSLPMFPELTETQVDQVAAAVREALKV